MASNSQVFFLSKTLCKEYLLTYVMPPSHNDFVVIVQKKVTYKGS